MPHGTGADCDLDARWYLVSLDDVGRWLAMHRSYCVDGNFTALQRSRLCGLADRYTMRVEADSLTKTEAA